MTHVHLIGIGGSGISSIARVLLEKGYRVSGSDRVLSPLALDLRQAGAAIYRDHSAANIAGADLVVRSSAINDDNPEVVAALQAGIPVLKRSEFLKALIGNQDCIAIAGTHGKTTTSAMMAYSLNALGYDSSYILGGVSKDLHGNAHAGSGRYFVIEADEYDHMFLGLEPELAIITNVEYDHPDCFPTRALYVEAFRSFINHIQPGGSLITSADQDTAFLLSQDLPAGVTTVTYGLSERADMRAFNLSTNERGGTTFDLATKDLTLTAVSLQVPGEHNVRNALGVLAAHYQLGNPIDKAAAALAGFSGTGRRFDLVGEVNGITVIDDYAHHPSKITATLSAARLRYPGRRLVAVWQPHTYSRTIALRQEFINSLQLADHVVITDIYAAREKPQALSPGQLAAEIKTIPAVHIPEISGVTDYLLDLLKPGDVLLVLSAGDADQVCRTVLQRLKERIG